LEKLSVNRIMHHVYRNDLLIHYQFGFTPKKSAMDTAMAVMEFAE